MTTLFLALCYPRYSRHVLFSCAVSDLTASCDDIIRPNKVVQTSRPKPSSSVSLTIAATALDTAALLFPSSLLMPVSGPNATFTPPEPPAVVAAALTARAASRSAVRSASTALDAAAAPAALSDFCLAAK